MKIQTNTLNEHKIQSAGKVTNMKLDGDSQAMIFQMFTGGLYSDPIGTVIREIASNCFDSHIEAGVDSAKNPVIVELGNDASGHFITFTDKGVGMSPDRIDNIYGTYFKSTKRNSNSEIGGFGLGGKTPLAYTESFFIITQFDGVEYVYNVFEGNEVPAVELMSQTSTNKENGTTVKIPVKQYDIIEFEKKTLRQLYYFENIVFKGFSDRFVSNDYSIVKGKNFLYRGNEYSDYVHVCYGKVAYPLDFDAMGLEKYDFQIPIAIKLEIGELEGTGVTPSREALKYTKENVRIIKSKLEAVVEELKGMLSKQYKDVTTLFDYYKATKQFGTLYFDNDRSIYLRDLIKKSDVEYPNFKFKGLTVPSDNEIMQDFYNIKLYGKKYATSSWKRKGRQWDERLGTIVDQDNLYYNDGEFNRKIVKQAYLKAISESENFYILTPKELTTDHTTYLLRKYGAMQEILNDDSTSDDLKYKMLMPRGKAIKMIEAMMKEVHSLLAKYRENYDDVEVTDEFIQSRKKDRLSKEVLNTTIPVKCKAGWGRERLTLEELASVKGSIYYGFRDDESALSSAKSILEAVSQKEALSVAYVGKNRYSRKTRGTMFIVISQGNEKYMNMLGKKAIHVKHFYKTFVARKLDRIINSMIANKVSDSFYYVEDFIKSDIMEHICKDTYEQVQEVKQFLSNANTRIGYRVDRTKVEVELGVSLDKMEVANQYSNIIEKLKKLSVNNKSKMQWFNLPSRISPDSESHKELIEMIQLVFEK